MYQNYKPYQTNKISIYLTLSYFLLCSCSTRTNLPSNQLKPTIIDSVSHGYYAPDGTGCHDLKTVRCPQIHDPHQCIWQKYSFHGQNSCEAKFKIVKKICNTKPHTNTASILSQVTCQSVSSKTSSPTLKKPQDSVTKPQGVIGES